MQNNKRHITGYLLAILFVFYFAGANFFSHSHIDEYHRLIVHSHPFSSESNHQHSSANFLTIDKLSNIFVGFIFFGICFLAVFQINKQLINGYGRNFFKNTYYFFRFSRPPPSL
jgi:hypothetical protein